MISNPCPTCGRAWSSRPEAIIRHNRTLVFTCGRWRREEIVLMEAHIGQALPPGSRVKHLNGDTMDNRLENLFLELPGEPNMFRRLNDEVRPCKACGDEFLARPWENSPRFDYCSRRCFELTCRDNRARGLRRYPKRIDPDRWRAWKPEIAWAARMIPEPDSGPGGPNRYPVIAIPAPLDGTDVITASSA